MKLLGVIIFSCICLFVSGLPQYPNEPQDIRRNYEESNRIPAPRDLYNSESVNEWEIYPNSLKYRSLDASRSIGEAEEEETEVEAEEQKEAEESETSKREEPSKEGEREAEEGETSKREEPSKEGEREAEEGETSKRKESSKEGEREAEEGATSKRKESSKEGEREAEKEQPEGEGESQRRKGEEAEQSEGEAAENEQSEQGKEKPQILREEQEPEQEIESSQGSQAEQKRGAAEGAEAESEQEADSAQEAQPEAEAEVGAEREAEAKEEEAAAEPGQEAELAPESEQEIIEAATVKGLEVEQELGPDPEPYPEPDPLPDAEQEALTETEAKREEGAAGETEQGAEAEAEAEQEAEVDAEAERKSQGEQSESGAEAAEAEGQQEGEAAGEEKLTILQEEPELFEAVSESSSQPEQPQEGSQPEQPKEGSQPEQAQEGSQPEQPQELSQPEQPQDGSQPEQPREDSPPSEQSPESSTDAQELRTEEPRSEMQDSTDTSMSFDTPAEDQSVMLEQELEPSPEKEQSTEQSPQILREEATTVASDSFLLNEETRADLEASESEVVTEKLVEELTEPQEGEAPMEPVETVETRTDAPSELVREGQSETTVAPADTMMMMEEQEAEPSFDGIVSDPLRQRMEGSALLSMIRERESATGAPEEVSSQPTESQVCADAVDALLSAFAESFETESPITAFEVGKTYSLFAYGLGTLERDGEVTITKDSEGRRMISSNIRIGPVTITNQADAEKRSILEFSYSGKIELLLDESVTPPALTVLSFDLGTLEDGGVTLINQANPEDKELLFESVVSAMSTRLKLRSLYQNLFTSLAEREEISSKFSFPTEGGQSKKLEYVIS